VCCSVCCSVLQCIVLQCVSESPTNVVNANSAARTLNCAFRYSLPNEICVALCCGVLQCVQCSVLQWVAVCSGAGWVCLPHSKWNTLMRFPNEVCVAVCCGVLQYVQCSMLQWVAMCGGVGWVCLQHSKWNALMPKWITLLRIPNESRYVSEATSHIPPAHFPVFKNSSGCA